MTNEELLAQAAQASSQDQRAAAIEGLRLEVVKDVFAGLVRDEVMIARKVSAQAAVGGGTRRFNVDFTQSARCAIAAADTLMVALGYKQSPPPPERNGAGP